MGEEMKNCHIGSKSEIEARLWFLQHGYEVFENISACGPIDLITLEPKTKALVLIDIKTQRIINKRWKKIELKDEQKALNVKLCYRLPDGSFSFDLPEIDDYWMEFNIHKKPKKSQAKKPKTQLIIKKDISNAALDPVELTVPDTLDIENKEKQELLTLNVVSLYMGANNRHMPFLITPSSLESDYDF